MKKIALLTGGTSSEREVALNSSQMVQQALEAFYDVVLFDIPLDLPNFLKSYKEYAVVVPVFHGPGGEDGVIQGFLKTLNIPFIFSDVEAHAVAMNKFVTKLVALKEGIVTPQYVVLKKDDTYNFTHPVVVKPLEAGSSVGVTVVHKAEDINLAIATAFEHSTEVLVEDFIEGQELTVGVVSDKNGLRALPPILIKPKSDFFDYKSKYTDGMSEEICPAPISEDITKQLQEAAVKIHKALGVRHMSRSDFRVDKDSKCWFLEINTIPGMTKNSLIPKMLRTAGIDFGKLLSEWIEEVGGE